VNKGGVGKDSEFPTIKAALKKAGPGDHIHLRGNTQEYVQLDDKRYQFLTIESDNPDVMWRYLDEPRDKKRCWTSAAWRA
jgi:hypothetical protein